MMRFIYLSLLCLIIITGCGNEKGDELSTFKYYYDEEGQLDSITFISKENGDVFSTYYQYFDNGKTRTITRFKNDCLYGFEDYYSLDGEIVSQLFYINNKPLIKSKLFSNQAIQGSNVRFYYFIENDSTFSKMGVLAYDSTNAIIDSQSFYYEVNGDDTIGSNSDLYLTVKAYAMGEQYQIDSIILGELNKDYGFISREQRLLNIATDSVSFSLKPKTLGDNLLMGKMYVTGFNNALQDSLYREFIFLYNYFVLPDNYYSVIVKERERMKF